MRKKMRIGINGFGRIGRIAARIILDRSDLSLVAINSRADISSHSYLLQYDSTYGTYSSNVEISGNKLIVKNNKIDIYRFDKPNEIPWHKSKVDIVIDSTGVFRTSEKLLQHLKKGVRQVVLSAPAKDDIKTLVLGINEHEFNPQKDKIISNSSCTTNCLSTTLKVLHENFHVVSGFMTTVHAVTDSQNLLDNSHKKGVRLRRSAFISLIPTSTGSAKDIGKLFPDLCGKIICQALRIPLFTVSMIVLSVKIKKKTTADQINTTYQKWAKGKLKGIIDVASEELVSRDYVGSPYSSIIDPFLTRVVSKNFVNVYAWYDNEWGYACRLIDMVCYIGKKRGLI